MKKIFAALAGAAAVAVLAAPAAMAGECSTATLTGHYTYWLQGFDENGKPYAEVGAEHFDGKGNGTAQVGVAGKAGFEADKSTYTIDADCTGTITYASGAKDKISIASSGDNFVFSSAKEGVVQAGEDTRVDKD